MDVVNVEQAILAEKAGACAVMVCFYLRLPSNLADSWLCRLLNEYHLIFEEMEELPECRIHKWSRKLWLLSLFQSVLILATVYSNEFRTDLESRSWPSRELVTSSRLKFFKLLELTTSMSRKFFHQQILHSTSTSTLTPFHVRCWICPFEIKILILFL